SVRFGFSADRCVCVASRFGCSNERCSESFPWCGCLASRYIELSFSLDPAQESFFCCLVRLPTAIIIGVPMIVGKNQKITGGQLLITGIFGVFVTSTAVIIPI